MADLVNGNGGKLEFVNPCRTLLLQDAAYIYFGTVLTNAQPRSIITSLDCQAYCAAKHTCDNLRRVRISRAVGC